MVDSQNITIATIKETGQTQAKDAAVWIDAAAYAAVPVGALFAQQGDVYLQKLAEVPVSAESLSPRLQLVPGVSMGSRHCLDSLDGVKQWIMPNRSPLEGPILELFQARAMTHPKHGDICNLPAGSVIQIRYQRAYAADALRRVID